MATAKKATAKAKTEVLKSKRFVIRKALIGKGAIVEFTNKEGKVYKYNHDEVFNANKARFEEMNCFKKYKSYTATNSMPTFARDFIIE